MAFPRFFIDHGAGRKGAVVFCFFLPAAQPMNANPSPPESSPAESVAGRRLAEIARELDDKLADAERAPEPGRRHEILAEARAVLAELAVSLRQADETASLSAFLQRNVEDEKAALARELHDQLGGILTPAKMDISWLQARLSGDPQYDERMERLNKLIDQGIDLKRRIIESLRPSLLDHLGLASALHWYLEETCRGAGIEPHLDISRALERLPADLEIACFRLMQEGVTNVVKHARAKHLDVTVERTGRGLHMTVSDDGVGIEDLEAAKRLAHGLAGMSHRARSVSGTFKVQSRPGKGTRLEFFVPLPARPAP